MRTPLKTFLGIVVLSAAAVAASGCHVDVDANDTEHKANVDIKTPVGHVSVRAGHDAPDTGLRVYPGARVQTNHDGARESANVNVGGTFFGVQVEAAKFESDDSPEQIAAFYRNELKPFGPITECHGDVDYHHGGHAACKGSGSSSELQLAVGPENNQHIVAITPHGSTTEFALVHVDTRGTKN